MKISFFPPSDLSSSVFRLSIDEIPTFFVLECFRPWILTLFSSTLPLSSYYLVRTFSVARRFQSGFLYRPPKCLSSNSRRTFYGLFRLGRLVCLTSLVVYPFPLDVRGFFFPPSSVQNFATHRLPWESPFRKMISSRIFSRIFLLPFRTIKMFPLSELTCRM